MAVYKVEGSAVQDEDDLLTWQARCEQDGQVDTGATACTVTLYQCDGDGTVTAVDGATETVTNPDARGTFNGSFTVTLTAGALYHLYVSMTVDAATKVGHIDLMLPARTA